MVGWLSMKGRKEAFGAGEMKRGCDRLDLMSRDHPAPKAWLSLSWHVDQTPKPPFPSFRVPKIKLTDVKHYVNKCLDTPVLRSLADQTSLGHHSPSPPG